MEIVYKKPKELKPYERNPRINDQAVEAVKNSITEFGFKVPIVIDTDNVVVCGHTRLKAAKELHMRQVPCIVADDLSEEQIRAFRLADNKTAELADWDFDMLNEEIESIFEIDMEEFGFELYDPFEEHEEQQEKTQERVSGIENLEKGQYPGEGYYDIPIIKPVKKLPAIKEWIPFNYVLSDDEPEGKAVHFFIDDYQFERIWKNTDAYVDKLKQYVCVASPDFSPYGDMPMALQIFSHYKKHWVAAFLQDRGVTVIPTIRASTHPNSFDWYLDGEPHGGIVLISSMWSGEDDIQPVFEREYNTMLETLKPKKIYVYGKETIPLAGNVEYIKSFSEKRWKDE